MGAWLLQRGRSCADSSSSGSCAGEGCGTPWSWRWGRKKNTFDHKYELSKNFPYGGSIRKDKPAPALCRTPV